MRRYNMAFSPFARFRNFTVENLKALLEVYPDQAGKLTWSEAGNEVEAISNGYKKTSYQQACQFGIEDRGKDYFRVQNYLYTFDDEYLAKYLEFWIKTYYAPNPYVNSEDKPMLIYCELVKAILESENHKVNYYDFFNNRIGGKSDDILMNALKAYGNPLQYEKVEGKHFFYIREKDIAFITEQVRLIESEFAIENPKDKSSFFNRFSFDNFCKFHGISASIIQDNKLEYNNTRIKRITGGENILLYGVPGAGKSYKIATEYCNNEDRMVRVVFHPDYTYSDFVGQILPVVEGKDLSYKFTPGPFTQIMKMANDNPGYMYYLIIEEINRGNAPAIFGEIFQLLDRKDSDSYSEDLIGESEYGIVNYDVAKAVYGNADSKIRIPSNLTILATMNTADQNVFTLDTAFQRRWNMKQIENDVLSAKHADSVITGTEITWGSFAYVVNGLIIENSAEIASSADKRLGAYFVKEREFRADLFSEKVLKYLWDDAFKFDHELIFRDDINSLEGIISTYEHAEPDKLKSVLRMDVYKKMLQAKMKNASDENEE